MSEIYFTELERGVRAALETYSNVHRGTGHNSMVTTDLYEHAREVVLEHLQLIKNKYTVIFCSPIRSETLKSKLNSKKMFIVSSRSIGIPLGIRAIAVKKDELSKYAPFQTGGGMVKMVYPKSAIWADDPDRFEAGTPNIINAIILAKSLLMIRHYGDGIFKKVSERVSTVAEILNKDEFTNFSGKELLLRLRKSLVGRDILVPTVEGEKSYINLDNAASTPTFSPIWDVVCQTWRQPRSIQEEIIQEAKKICSEFLDAPINEFETIYTLNTTEAINIAIQSLIASSDEEFIIVNTILEHNSNDLPLRYVPGVSLIRLLVDDAGFLDLIKLEKLLCDYNQDHKHGKKRILLITVSGASNVLGSFNDIQKISQIAHKYGAYILVDGAQLVAHRKVSLSKADIDFFAFSGHKMYAPFGTGALIIKKSILNLNTNELALIKNFGEENVVGIAAIGKAMKLLQRIGMDVIEDQERILTTIALNGLNKNPNIKIFGETDPESPRFKRRGGTFVLSLKNVPHNLVAKELAEFGGIGVRNGCFCAHMLVKHLTQIPPVRVFAARLGLMLIPKTTNILLPGLVRISFGIENDKNDVDHLIQILNKLTQEPRSLVNRFIASLYNGTPFLPVTETQKRIEEFIEESVSRVYGVPKH